MKRILPAIYLSVCLICFSAVSKAEEIVADNITEETQLEEVVLSQSEDMNDYVQSAGITEEEQPKTLKEKLRDVYNLEVDKYDTPEYLFREVLTHKCKPESKMDNWHIWGAYNAYIDNSISDNGSYNGEYVFNALNVGFDGFLKNNADFRIMLGFPINSTRNYVQTLFSDVYIASNKIPHHRIQIGYYRPQVGIDGGSSAYTLEFLGRSQIGRTFGKVRKLGARVKGDYSFIDYDFGVYSSDTFLQEFFPGAEFISWVNLKPLAKVEDKYGKLKIGGGIDAGHRDNNFMVTGAYVGYEYKKFIAEFEWAQGNGYNGYADRSTRKHASGFYTTLGYMITKRLQILGCYDQFNPDRHIAGNNKREFTLGLNYFIKGQALRVMLNYAFCQNDCSKDSHRIMLGTQILI